MGRPYRPQLELEAHLDRGELEFAIALARAIARERERPLDLELTARFLPLIALQRPGEFDSWTLRWLERWCAAGREQASIDDAAELAAALAEIPVDPERGMRTIRELSTRRSRGRPL